MADTGTAPCVLCGNDRTEAFFADRRRSYLRCPNCDLVFVPRQQLLSVTDERVRYDQHHNSAADAAYLRYVDACVAELRRLPLVGARILDFGCGQHAVMTARLREQGLDCTAYDPLYELGGQALAGKYDVIAAIEVVEHLRDPRHEFDTIANCLAPGGYLFVRTLLRRADVPFVAWWYKNDPTHVNFFSAITLRFVSRAWNLLCEHSDDRQIVVLKATSGALRLPSQP
jgi:cyclopropane fatty-acyl-phospholipid synthase-like methyltransferase